jgi:hypothetical protein
MRRGPRSEGPFPTGCFVGGASTVGRTCDRSSDRRRFLMVTPAPASDLHRAQLHERDDEEARVFAGRPGCVPFWIHTAVTS